MAYQVTQPRGPAPAPRIRDGTSDNDGDLWRERTRLVMAPTAPPSILGLFGFAGATFIVAAYLAHWYGSGTSQLYLIPFALVFGGVAQLIAGLFAYRARDGLATAMHGMWGSFWIAYGLLWILDAAGALKIPAGANFPELGWWFIPLAAITFMGAVAAIAVSRALTGVLGLLAAGSALAAIGFIGAFSGVVTAAGYVLVASAAVAFYTASAMMLEGTFRRAVLPVGRAHRGEPVDGAPLDVIEYPFGMPGAHAGQ
jgi:succinate-acetate transporter protein